MTPEQFAYWLQGFVEIRDSRPTTREWDVIKYHLSTIFNKVTPNKYPHPIRPGGLPPGPGLAEPYRGIQIGTPWTPATDLPGPSVTCSVSSVTGNDWLSKKDSQGETV